MRLKALTLAAGALMLSAGAASAAVVTGDLNLRTGPGTNYRVIDMMPAGARVDVLSCTGSWCRVNFRGEVGFASASYLGRGAPVYAAAPPPVYVAPPPVYVAPPPVITFGFGIGPRWHHRHHRHWRHWRHHRWH
jgi:uncharacterized protein YraI